MGCTGRRGRGGRAGEGAVEQISAMMARRTADGSDVGASGKRKTNGAFGSRVHAFDKSAQSGRDACVIRYEDI